MRSAAAHRLKRPSWGLSILSCLALAVLWILFVGSTRIHEMLAGSIVLALSAAFLFRVARMESLELDFQVRDLLAGWRIPWYILVDNYTILAVLVKDVAGVKKAESLYRFCGFKTSAHDARLMARQVLATAYTTASPNSIVIGIDVRQSRMLFHQLQRTKIALMTKELGAQPGVDQP